MPDRKTPLQCPQVERDAVLQLFATGYYANSERLARKITVTYPDDAFGWKALGSTLLQVGRTEDALEPMQKAADLEPRDAEARTNLGIAFAALGRLEEAVAAYRTAIGLNPTYPEAYNNLGNALRELDRPGEAVAAYRTAIELNPAYPEAHNNLGNALRELGRLREAETAYRAALTGNPKLTESHYGLGLLGKYAENDPRIPHMERLYRERQLPESNHTHICFALGKACEDLGRIDDAFAYYAEGNRLRKRQLGYTLDRDRRLFAAIRAAFSEATPLPPPDADAEPRPIFIVGMLRSGTTLAEQILASHSQVFGAGELEAMNHALLSELSQDGLEYRFNRDADAIARIRERYREELVRLAPDMPVIIDKMPSHFRWIGFMLEAFPEAKVVNLVRDPVAVCWSIYKRYFPSTGNGFTYDLADLGGYYGLYRELMAFWCERFPGRIYDLNYERLTENQEQETRALLEFCDLPWEEGCIDFHKTERAIRTASALQVRKKLYRGSSEAWKTFEKHLRPLTDALGTTIPEDDDGKRSSPSQEEKDAVLKLFAAGCYADSERLARNMTATYPDDAFGWKVLGAALQHIGRAADALEPMQRAADLAHRDAEAHRNLGSAFASLSRCEEAVAAYRTAIELKPSYPEAYNGLGNAFETLGRLNEAEDAYRTAIELKPQYPEAYNGLGNALKELGRLHEAETAYRRSIELRPGYPEAHNNLGNILLEMGRVTDAESAYHTAIANNPRLTESYHSLGLLGKYAENDPRIPRMERLYRERQLPESNHMHICFALGKAYEDLERIDNAFACYAEGNRLRKRQLGYSLDRDRRLFAAIRAAFSQAMPLPPPADTQVEPRPIFIVGMPRSGTTLVEQILASHSQVFGAGEQQEMTRALFDEFDSDEAEHRFHHDANAIARIRRHYRATLERLAPGTPVVTDKMPTNFRWIGFILEAFPEAKVVNLVRDPVATCWSIYKHFFSSTGNGFAYDLADLAGYYGLYQELMAFWRERFPGRIYDLNYERLTENQEDETRALLDFCDLAWEEGCLDFHQTERTIHTSSSMQVREKLYKGSSEAWKRFGKHLRPLTDALGTTTPESDGGKHSSPSQAEKDAVVRLFDAGRYADSERLARNMTTTYPDNAFGWSALGAALDMGGHGADALGPLQKATSLAPQAAEAHYHLGIVFTSLGRLEEAMAAYRRAIALTPGYPEAYNNLGNALLDLGRLKEAEEAYRKAIAGNAKLAVSHRNLGLLATYTEDDPQISIMESLYQEGQLPESDHIHICFALGKAYEDLGRIDDAFARYAEGNRLLKQSLGYTIERDQALFEAMRTLFSNMVERKAVNTPHKNSPRPIFIVGMPRSGTTLAEQILASHSQVFGAGELTAMDDAVLAQFNPDGMAFHFTLSESAMAGLRSHYLTALRELDTTTQVVTDKMPTNFRWIGFMLEAFPEARVVNLARDPVAVCWSIYKHHFSKGIGFAYDLADLAGYYGLYRELMAFWRERFPGRIYDLNYERLTENQEEETRALLEFCDLPWEEGCLDFHRTERAIHSASVVQVRKKLYQGSSEAWRKFAKHLRPLTEALHIISLEDDDR